MGKAFRKALDRRGTHSRTVGVHVMVSNCISLLLELKAYMQPRLHEEPGAESLLAEFRDFETAATNYLKGGR